MGTIRAFTAERMLQIEESTIVSGLVDVRGNLILKTRVGDPLDAGYVKGDKGDKGDKGATGTAGTNGINGVNGANGTNGTNGTNGFYALGPWPGGTRYYHRLATIDGGSEQSGAHLQFLISGLGNYGTPRRGTALVHLAQRGANAISVKAWGFGFDEASDPITLYTLQISTYKFELWALSPLYSMSEGITVLANSNGTINNDSARTSAPSGLVQQAIYSMTNISSLTSGTINDGQLPPRLQNYAWNVSNGNFNDLDVTGFYRGSSMANSPNGPGWWYCETVAHDGNWVTQRATGFTDVGLLCVYTRQKSGGTWTGWSLAKGPSAATYARAEGVITIPPALETNASATYSVTFPSGRFSVAPNVMLTSYSTRYTPQVTINTVTTSGFACAVSNYSNTTASSGSLLGWSATQMTPNSGIG